MFGGLAEEALNWDPHGRSIERAPRYVCHLFCFLNVCWLMFEQLSGNLVNILDYIFIVYDILLLYYCTMFRWCQICGHDQSDPVCIHGSCPLVYPMGSSEIGEWNHFALSYTPKRLGYSRNLSPNHWFAHENDLNVEWFWGSQQLFNSSFPTGGLKEASHHVKQPIGRW